ncbi:MAG: DUF2608 domain-containing protein [Myxococcaceae bacterium]|nr:DUF2608 domain-containing protein [Myxococcaceae bacterium]MBH2006348.1 DUF2608 domain-containing protein [Myxococcaceae bacterium]
MILISILIFCLASSVSLSKSEFSQINSIVEVKKHVNETSLLVFDLDNTVFQAAVAHCHANVFYDQVKTGTDPVEAYSLWENAQENCPVSAVEASTPDWIRSFQKRGIQVMGLTSRGFTALETTKRQLQSIGVDLALTAPNIDWENYDSGILFVSVYKSKGEQLIDFLKAQSKTYSRVVMVDDLKKNLESVGESLAKANVPFTGLYYPMVTDPSQAALK